MKSPDSVLEHEGQQEEEQNKAEPLRRVKGKTKSVEEPRKNATSTLRKDEVET